MMDTKSGMVQIDVVTVSVSVRVSGAIQSSDDQSIVVHDYTLFYLVKSGINGMVQIDFKW